MKLAVSCSTALAMAQAGRMISKSRSFLKFLLKAMKPAGQPALRG